MDVLREQLYGCILAYGNLDPRTIKVSQELDNLIVKAMKGGEPGDSSRCVSFRGIQPVCSNIFNN